MWTAQSVVLGQFEVFRCRCCAREFRHRARSMSLPTDFTTTTTTTTATTASGRSSDATPSSSHGADGGGAGCLADCATTSTREGHRAGRASRYCPDCLLIAYRCTRTHSPRSPSLASHPVPVELNLSLKPLKPLKPHPVPVLLNLSRFQLNLSTEPWNT